MRGVSYSPTQKRWYVTYYNRENNIKFKASRRTESECIEIRKQFETKYGIPHGSKWKTHNDKNISNFKIIGSTDKTDDFKNQKVVAFNKITKQYLVSTINSLKRSSGIPQKVAQIGMGKGFIKEDNKFVPRIKLNGKVYELGRFETVKEAHEKYIKTSDEFKKSGKIPDRLSEFSKSNSNFKNISYSSERKKYVFYKNTNGSRYSKRFNTLDEAITYRNDFLKEHNLPIPKN